MATSKSTRKRSTTDRRAEMQALHDKLAAQVESLRDSAQWSAYLQAVASFHRYSFGNMLLIFAQCPDATRVAGYRTWQGIGRQVRKGERSIRILGTGTRKVTDEDEGGQENETRQRFFFPVSVFDISQTDLMDGADDVLTVAQNLTGEDEGGIFARVVEYLAGQGIEVERRPLGGSCNGFTARRDPEDPNSRIYVVVDSELSDAQAAKTGLHETAHIALGHLDSDDAEYRAHRGRCEVEAESVAYVMAGLLGLDSSSYSTGYVAGWSQSAEADVLKATAAHVLTAVHSLAGVLLPEDPATDEADSGTTTALTA